METLTEKICTKCRIEKPPSEFYKDPTAKDGRDSRCKSCGIARASAYFTSPEGRLSNRKAHYKRHYGPGMTPERYDKMFSEQNGVCAICGQPEIVVDKRYGKVEELSIDHNHETGQVRGLLCHKCNQGIGLLKHDKVRLSKAISYLIKHEG